MVVREVVGHEVDGAAEVALLVLAVAAGVEVALGPGAAAHLAPVGAVGAVGAVVAVAIAAA